MKRPEGHAPVAPAAAPAQAAAAPRRARFGLGRLRERGARFFGWLSRPRPAAAKPAVPRFEPLPIQGELALNRIKVMCNDLSDADLEVVPRAPAAPAKSPPSPAVKSQPELAPATTASAAPAPKAGAARAAWNRAGRLLGGTKS